MRLCLYFFLIYYMQNPIGNCETDVIHYFQLWVWLLKHQQERRQKRSNSPWQICALPLFLEKIKSVKKENFHSSLKFRYLWCYMNIKVKLSKRKARFSAWIKCNVFLKVPRLPLGILTSSLKFCISQSSKTYFKDLSDIQWCLYEHMRENLKRDIWGESRHGDWSLQLKSYLESTVSLTIHSHQNGAKKNSSVFWKTKILLIALNPSIFKSKQRLVNN